MVKNAQPDRQKAEQVKNQLLADARSLIIAAGSGDDLEMGTVPFIIEQQSFYIFTSELSAQTKAILAGQPAQFMIVADEQASQNIWARQRLIFQAARVVIARDDPEFDRLCDQIGDQHGPVMALIKPFQDFHLIRLTPIAGRLVLGFAAAYHLSGAGLQIGERMGPARSGDQKNG